MGSVRLVAYLDANSGSMIAAAVASGLAGIAVVVKLWWRRLTGALSPKRRAARAEATAAEAVEPAPAEAGPVAEAGAET
jgi:hypothetical protein